MADPAGHCTAYSIEKLSAFVDGDLSAGDAQAVRAHGVGCPRCAAVLSDLSALVSAARGLDRPEPPPTLWAAVEGSMERHDRPWWMALRLFGTGALAGAAAVSVVALATVPDTVARAAADADARVVPVSAVSGLVDDELGPDPLAFVALLTWEWWAWCPVAAMAPTGTACARSRPLPSTR